MKSANHWIAEGGRWVLCYVLGWLMVFAGTALSLYMWAAPFEHWDEMLSLLFWQSFIPAAPVCVILRASCWRRRFWH
ncbi:hypothetical protein [Hydrogenophaga sp. T2]|uniref:hypothetical protein n=1 Tax=Hydrogenophaga sp. T2 TaxID=3132823 RepID=UPI003CEE87EA